MKRILSVLVTAVMILTLSFQDSFAAQITAEDAYSSTGRAIYENTAKSPVYGAEWHILGLARSEYTGCDEIFEKYYEDVVKKLKDSKGVLSKNKYTDYSRAITAVRAIGRNPRNIGGYDMVSKLLEKENVAKQGINGPVWALIALNTGGYADSSGEFKKTAAEYVNDILEAEKDGGGWSLNSPETNADANADADITAMALTALAPYCKGDSKVKEAADRALAWLSEVQKDDGAYASWGTVNSESCAQVTVALTSLGIDPNKDERFIKNGKSVIDGLLGFYTDGGFKHVSTGKLNAMATEQGYYALTAYFRFTGGKTSLYDMSDTGTAAPAALAKAKLVSVKSVSKKGVKITWNKVKTAKGYQIKYSAKKNMKGAKTVTSGSLSKKITKLKSGKRYYFKVRAYKSADGSRIYGGWSSVKSVKVK